MNIYSHNNQFINNKYTKWYYDIVLNAQYRSKNNNSYYESHHVLPKCIFPEFKKEKWNLVLLTAREHFICHLLLTKMTENKNRYRMLQAAVSFTKWTTKKQIRTVIVNSRLFEKLKKERSLALKELWQTDEQYRNAALAGFRQKNKDQLFQKVRSDQLKTLWKDPAYREKMSNRKRTYKKVIIFGIVYDSMIEAGKALNISSNRVSKRCSSQQVKFADWNYC